MNDARRDKLREASGLLDKASDMISSVLIGEGFAMSRVPENLQETARYEHMEECVEAMEDARQSIGDAKESLSQAIS